MKIHIIAAHPDDEVLGCGATIARHAEAGDQVTVTLLTDGVGAREGVDDAAIVSRKQDAEKSAAILGIADLRFHNFPDNKLDSLPLLDIVKTIEADADRIDADMVYIHHPGDLNIDHKIAAKAALTCYRPQPASSVKRILAFETLSATGWDFGEPVFQPNVFIDAEPYLERKLAALEAYASEMRPFPHARSLEAVHLRSASWGTLVGLTCAEPFMLVREIAK